MSVRIKCAHCSAQFRLRDNDQTEPIHCPRCDGLLSNPNRKRRSTRRNTERSQQPQKGTVKRIIEKVGLANSIAGSLSLTFLILMVTRSHLREDFVASVGGYLIFNAILFCIGNAIQGGREIARAGVGGIGETTLWYLLFDGIFFESVSRKTRLARNGLWVGLLSLVAGTTCLSIAGI